MRARFEDKVAPSKRGWISPRGFALVVHAASYALLLGLATACGGTETASSTSTNGGSDGGGAGGSSGSSGSSGASGSSGSTGASGTSNVCGGAKCSFGQRCAHETCGAPDSEGKCEPLPQDCIYPLHTWNPVCGCDGRVRPVNCYDADLGPASNCTKFPCGSSECMIATQYCERQVSDVGGVPDGYSCKPLPASCTGAAGCSCLRAEPCGASCAGGTGALGMVLTCPGG